MAAVHGVHPEAELMKYPLKPWHKAKPVQRTGNKKRAIKKHCGAQCFLCQMLPRLAERYRILGTTGILHGNTDVWW
jgi:hypothetical protein